MAKVTFKINGIEAMKRKIEKAIANAQPAVASALMMFAEGVMTASKRIVPVETGNLMSSGHVQPPETSGSRVTVTFGYGGPAAEYALYVHEALEGPNPINPNWSWAKAAAAGKSINWTRPGSGPKYLERPLKARQDKLPGIIAAAVKGSVT